MRRTHIYIEGIFFIIFMAPFIIHGAWLITGLDYPRYFFNVDNAWTLQFVHALEQKFTYPPENIACNIEGSNYQYGVVYLAHLLSNIFGLKGYEVLYIILPLFFGSIIYISIRLLLKRRYKKKDGYFLLGLLVALFMRYVPFALNPFVNFLNSTGVEKGPFYLAQAIQIQALSGAAILALMMLIILREQSRLIDWVFLKLLFILLILFKASYIFFFLALVPFDLYKNRMSNLKLFAFLDIVFVLFGAIVLKEFVKPEYEFFDEFNKVGTFVSSGSYIQLKAFGVFGMMGLFNIVLFVCPLLYLLVQNKRDAIVILPILLMIGIFSIVYIDSPNKHQFLAPVKFIVPIIIGLNVERLKNFRIYGYVYLGFFILPNVIGGIRYTNTLVNSPMNGHEYVVNDSLADALSHIDIEGTVIITNDLRYPADNFLRENRQFQLSGLFGHHFYNAELFYTAYGFPGSLEERSEFLTERFAITERIQNGSISLDDLIHELKEREITHVLLRKDFSHLVFDVKSVIYENNDYILLSVE